MIGIITCTKECNLRCKYCFEEKNFKTHSRVDVESINSRFRKAIPLIKKFCYELMEYNQTHNLRNEFTFHGGEPLLVLPIYIDEVCKYVRELDKSAKFNVQTNGTIITDEFINIFVKYDFLVGISVDGGQETHDENRVDILGKGTHNLVMKNIHKLREAGIRIGAMATITRGISQDAATFYKFYKDNSLNLGFNACYTSPDSINPNNKLDDTQYCKFLKELFDIWSNDKMAHISIRPFERIIRNIVCPSHGMEVCQFIKDCRGVNIAIDLNGKIYHCLHYVNLENGSIGSLKTESLKSIIERYMSMPSHWEHMQTQRCNECDIYNFCYGGCPYYSDAFQITQLEFDFNCNSQKFITHYIYQKLLEQINKNH